jgi:NADPH-dependent 2,4-dienoyl-CoA reductase/sulfur reductase-like enzyme
MKHVILGAGPAGVIAAETIRKHAPNDEHHHRGRRARAPYSRMAIPYLLMGNIGEPARTCARAPTTTRSCASRCNAAAPSLDTAARTVQLDDGRRCLRPPADRHRLVAGRAADSGHRPARRAPCWTLADARAIMKLAKPGARVLQMGAGFIGCIIMEALAARGVSSAWWRWATAWCRA